LLFTKAEVKEDDMLFNMNEGHTYVDGDDEDEIKGIMVGMKILKRKNRARDLLPSQQAKQCHFHNYNCNRYLFSSARRLPL